MAGALTWMWPVLIRQTLYAYCKTEALSLKHICCRKAINITYSRYLSVALFKQHSPYYVVMCGLSACTIFFHIIS